MSEPTVSVIIPAHNGQAWLDECLQSVLAQTKPPSQVLVVNDGSSDGTAEVLARYGSQIEVIHQAQAGIGAARNRGLEQARGDWIAFLDQDDRWRTDKLAIQLEHARRHPDQVLIYSDAEEFDERGTVHESFFDLFPRLRQPAGIFEAVIGLAVPLMSTVILQRRFLEQHRLRFHEPASGVDDVGLFLEIADRGGAFGCVDERLAYRRLHGSNLSKSHYNRFHKRVVLYQALQQRIRQPTHTRALRQGWRDANYRIGEWHWGRLERTAARQHFQQARGLDRLGLRAAAFDAATRLPLPVLRWLQQTKRAWLG